MKRVLYDWGDLNLWLFQAINGHSWHSVDSLMILAGYAADFWSFPVYAVIWALSVTMINYRGAGTSTARAQLQLQRFVAGYVIALIAVILFKYGLDFSRPMAVVGEHAVHVLGAFDSKHSLPSGHATFAMLLAATLWPLLTARDRAAAIIFVAYAGIARVWVGAHFPADVVAGYMLGLTCAAVAAAVVRRPVGFRQFQVRPASRDPKS